MLSIYTNKLLADWTLPRTLWGSSRRSPRPPSRTPDGLFLWHLHHTILAFGAHPGLQCPNYVYPSDMASIRFRPSITRTDVLIVLVLFFFSTMLSDLLERTSEFLEWNVSQ